MLSNRRGRKSMMQQQQQHKDSSDTSNNPLENTMNAADAAATTAALAALFMTPGQDPDERITVFNVEDGTRLTGNKAPKRIDLPRWLLAHPNYLPDESEIINMTLKNSAALSQMHNNTNSNNNNASNDQRSRRKSIKQGVPQQHDYMETSSLEDDEQPVQSNNRHSSKLPVASSSSNPGAKKTELNAKPPPSPSPTPSTSSQSGANSANMPLILFNKLNNKKLSGQKVPNWKMLAAFLEKNEQIYIDPTCNELVRSKFGRGNIPDIVKSRMISIASNKTKSSSSSQQQPLNSPQQQQRPNQSSQNRGSNSNSTRGSNSNSSNDHEYFSFF